MYLLSHSSREAESCIPQSQENITLVFTRKNTGQKELRPVEDVEAMMELTQNHWMVEV